MKYVNEDRKFWKHSWNVYLTRFSEPICVNADHEIDALNLAADYAEKQEWVGYFLSNEDVKSGDYQGNIIHAGNHGLPLIAREIYIKKID